MWILLIRLSTVEPASSPLADPPSTADGARYLKAGMTSSRSCIRRNKMGDENKKITRPHIVQG